MKYREYGNTGKKISVLGFGGNRFPKSLTSTEAGREECAKIVVRANDLGINVFDIAPIYGDGYGEYIFGLAFSNMKNPYYVSDKSRLSSDPDEYSVRKRIEASLNKMQIEKIHFFHMWCIYNIDHYHKIMGKGGPYEGAVKAKEEGLIDHICFSAHCTGEEITQIVEDGAFEGCIIGYNIINSKYRKKGIETAKDKNIGVMIMNPLAGGVIVRNRSFFEKYCVDGESVIDLSLRYVLSEPGVTSALSGISSIDQLEENVACIDNIDIGETSNERDKQLVDIQFDDLCTGCGYCVGCPQGIEVNKLMLAYNQHSLSSDDKDFQEVMFHLNEWWSYEKTKMFPCVGCRQCEIKCTQHLPIVSRIKEINEKAELLLKKEKTNIKELIGISQNVGIYGVGALAEQFIRECEDMGVLPARICMFDSNPEKCGKEIIPGYVVKGAREIVFSGIDLLVVTVGSYEVFENIRNSLQEVIEKGIDIKKYTSKI